MCEKSYNAAKLYIYNRILISFKGFFLTIIVIFSLVFGLTKTHEVQRCSRKPTTETILKGFPPKIVRNLTFFTSCSGFNASAWLPSNEYLYCIFKSSLLSFFCILLVRFVRKNISVLY